MSNPDLSDYIRTIVDYGLTVEVVSGTEIPHTYIPYYMKDGQPLYLGIQVAHGNDPYGATRQAINKAVDQILGL